MMNLTDTVKQLLIINIIFFVGSYIVGDAATDILALHSPQNDKFFFWQPLSHMFMHGGLMHIFFNMFALVSFGSLLEHMWGGKKFLFFYISCGLGAAALHLGVNYLEIRSVLDGAADLGLSKDAIHQILNVSFDDGRNFRDDLFKKEIIPILQHAGKLNLINQENYNSLFHAAVLNQIPAVGASGAIYGIMVAFAFIAPNAELMLMFVPVPIKAKYFVPGLVALDLFLGIKGESLFGTGTGVAHFAHIGGAVIGFIMMWYWKKNSFNDRRWN
jgi:membrane associated rhomboid family serine protease